MHVSIRAVLFDAYGTLLVSHAGGTHPDPELRSAIARAHAASPHPFPEVDIREIHAELRPELSSAEIEALAMNQERTFNPVSPMPGASDCLRELSALGLLIGLVSNAQFYTVPIVEECLGASLQELGVDRSLCFFSYESKRAKPDPLLFHAARDTLDQRGVPADSVLFVGNDVRNDIDPARANGFQTALLAGDPNLVRLHGRNLENSGADWILTKLSDLPHHSSILQNQHKR